MGLTKNKQNELLKIMKTKIRAQVKSRFYYVFWGTATIAVVLGQLYVGTGYRVLHGDMQELFNNIDGVLLRADEPKNYL